MGEIDLHIVAFNVPLPADYGGVIDVFYKLEALSNLGIKVALHCFDYGRGEELDLEKVAVEVYYYPRKANAVNAILLSPFTVKSRKNKQLLSRLAADGAPILFESLQSCFYIDHPDLAHKKKWVRAHNVEHHYYRSLASYESAGIRKAYYWKEAAALEKFENKLQHADGVLAISMKDYNYFSELGIKSYYLPAFYHQLEKSVEDKLDINKVALYQGNLQVEENIEAVLFLVEVFKKLPYQLIIAGSQPSNAIVELSKKMDNVSLVESPSDAKMFELIRTAKVSVLPSFQSTGIKLKLLHAMTLGNEVLVNPEMVEGTGLGIYCELATNMEEWRAVIKRVLETELNVQKIEKRRFEISELFNNQENAKKLVEWLGLVQ